MATGACATLSTCCQSLPSSEQSACTPIISLGDQMTCQTALDAFVDAGVCP
jgi:hypothetical protein